ncbi:MAG: TRAP transporter substrate-binding protein DctP [Pseudomonadota bacterium]
MYSMRNRFFAALQGSAPRRLRRSLVMGVALAISAMVAPVGVAQAQEVEIKLITSFPMEGPAADKIYAGRLFIERFNARAKGQARIRLVGGPEVVSPFDQLKALQTGQFDAMVTTQAYFNEMKGLQFINYLTSDEQVKAMPRGAETLQKISRENAGVTFVQLASPGLPFYLWTREAKPIGSVADFKGLKIRGLAGVNEQMVKYLGVVPTNLPSNDVYSALRGGILDGTLRDALSMELLNEGEYAKHRSEMRIADFSSELYVSNKVWDSLTPAVKQLMNSVARETEKEGLEWSKARVEKTNKLLADKYKVKIDKGTPELNEIIGRKIGGAMIKQIVDASKYKDELTDQFALQPYLKD